MYKHLYEIFKHWYCVDGIHQNSIYFIGDTHFGDLDSYKLRFPEKFNDSQSVEEQQTIVDELDQMQIKNCNRKCSKNSTLILLGDVGNIECVKKLKAGYKVLIMGNHDKGASNYKRIDNGATVLLDSKKLVCPHCGSDDTDVIVCPSKSYFSIKCRTCKELYEDTNVKRITLHREDNHLFDEVYEGTVQVGPKIILSHEPVDYPYALNIHGHVHSKTLTALTEHIHNDYSSYDYNCCAEQIDYKPVCINTFFTGGLFSFNKVLDIHRKTIDGATERKKKRTKKHG